MIKNFICPICKTKMIGEIQKTGAITYICRCEVNCHWGLVGNKWFEWDIKNHMWIEPKILPKAPFIFR